VTQLKLTNFHSLMQGVRVAHATLVADLKEITERRISLASTTTGQ
jgi:hypothetical protein